MQQLQYVSHTGTANRDTVVLNLFQHLLYFMHLYGPVCQILSQLPSELFLLQRTGNYLYPIPSLNFLQICHKRFMCRYSFLVTKEEMPNSGDV